MLNMARRTFRARDPRSCFTKHLTEAFDVQLKRYIYNENSSARPRNHRRINFQFDQMTRLS